MSSGTEINSQHTPTVQENALKNRPNHGLMHMASASQRAFLKLFPWQQQGIFSYRPMTALVIRVGYCSALPPFVCVNFLYRGHFLWKQKWFGACVCVCACVFLCLREKPWIARSLIHNCHVTLGLMWQTCLQQGTAAHMQTHRGQTVRATTPATLRRGH